MDIEKVREYINSIKDLRDTSAIGYQSHITIGDKYSGFQKCHIQTPSVSDHKSEQIAQELNDAIRPILDKYADIYEKELRELINQ